MIIAGCSAPLVVLAARWETLLPSYFSNGLDAQGNRGASTRRASALEYGSREVKPRAFPASTRLGRKLGAQAGNAFQKRPSLRVRPRALRESTILL